MMGGERLDAGQLMVHNLKAPLTGMLAMLEMIGDGDFGSLDQRQQEAVASVQSQGLELLGMIDELLDLWRVESMRVPPGTMPTDLAPVVQGLVQEWTRRLGGRISCEVVDGIPRAVCDPVTMRRVLANLLHNAEMHAGDEAEVRVRAWHEGGVLVLDVSDNGAGIPPADSERVFESFVTLGTRRDSGARPGGLGLAYCRAAMQAQGGAISLVDGGGPGATFRLTLPAAGTAGGDGGR